MKHYQKEYASGRPQMYDAASRKRKAKRMVKVLADYYGESELKNLTLLDIGSSTGIIDNELSPHFKKVVGTDIDEGAVSFAKKQFKKKNLIFKTEDAMKLTFNDNSFDIVICAQVYEHVPDAKKLFKEIHRVLKPGGTCYFAALNRLWPWEPHYNLLFLSWLTKPLANIYIKILRGNDEYYETTHTYWGLLKLTRQFKQIDYTEKILKEPKRFGYKIPSVAKYFSPILKYLTPTFFWILVKEK